MADVRSSRARTAQIPRVIAALAAASLCAVLLWRIVVGSLAAALATHAPAIALALRADQPEALFAVADAALRPVPPASPGAVARATDALGRGLRAAPLSAHGLALLGSIAPALSAAADMRLALALSLHESGASAWLLNDAVARRDAPAALTFADDLGRARPDLVPQLAPLLGRLAADPATKARFEQLVARDTAWRSNFFSLAPQVMADRPTLLRLILIAKDAPPPLLSDPIRGLIDAYLQRGEYGPAYDAWLQSQPDDRLQATGRLFNGDFRFEPQGRTFDWSIDGHAGISIVVTQDPDQPARNILRIDLGPGPVGDHSVEQTVLLTPGEYRFDGMLKSDMRARRGGFRWSIACRDSASSVLAAQIAPQQTKGWARFSLPFIVPAAGCQAQRVTLTLDTPSLADRLATGAISYAGLSINPAR